MAWQSSGAPLELLTCALQQGKVTNRYGGKGLGKGQLKDKTKEKSEEFLCRIKGWYAADHGLCTRYGKACCFRCGIPKNKAMNPPKAETTLWTGEPSQKTGGPSQLKGKGKAGGKGVRANETPKPSASSEGAEPSVARVPGGTPSEAAQTVSEATPQ